MFTDYGFSEEQVRLLHLHVRQPRLDKVLVHRADPLREGRVEDDRLLTDLRRDARKLPRGRAQHQAERGAAQ